MSQQPDFIGLGVEKAGTSWIFACLYEHPQICIPVKEINFFSNETLWQKGKEHYEAFFRERCGNTETLKGEYSTNYFFHEKVAERISRHYPKIKLLLCLRNPVERAFSNYLNDIKAGTINKNLDFEPALKSQNYYIEQGRYKIQFERYFSFFKKAQIKIMVYEDIAKNPEAFMQDIYHFIGVDPGFIPPSLHKRINTGRIPNNVRIEKWSNQIAAFFQKNRFGEKLWWLIKNSGFPQWVRNFNTSGNEKPIMSEETYRRLAVIFKEDIIYVEKLLDRKLNWYSKS